MLDLVIFEKLKKDSVKVITSWQSFLASSDSKLSIEDFPFIMKQAYDNAFFKAEFDAGRFRSEPNATSLRRRRAGKTSQVQSKPLSLSQPTSNRDRKVTNRGSRDL